MDGRTAINLVTGDGCDELKAAIEQARQDPGRPVTVGMVTVTWYAGTDDDYSTSTQIIEYTGGPDPVEWRPRVPLRTAIPVPKFISAGQGGSRHSPDTVC